MANQLSLATQQNLPVGYFPTPTSLANPGSPIDLNAVREYEREHLVRYSVTLSGNYVQHIRGTNTGEALNLQQALVPASYQAQQSWGYRGAIRGYILNTGGTGYSMSLVPGATCFIWLLCIFSGVATELAAGPYPAPLVADLDIVAEFSGRSFD